jgi:molecular chaperone GrpE (heat shock protein)
MHPERDLQTDPQQALRAAITEYEAARRRVERDAARVAEETRTRLVEQLLPVLDNVDRTIAATREAATIEGMRLVRAQLEKVLEGYGVARFDAVGERFDPRLHEAVGVAPVADTTLDGIVVDQWQAGYRIGDRLLRPARVQVGRFLAMH